MWNYTMELLRAAEVPAESGNHFVKYKHRATLLTEVFQRLQISRSGLMYRLRFQHYARNLLWMLVEQLLQAGKIVITKLHG